MKKLIAIAILASFSTPAFAGTLTTPPAEPYVPAPAPAPAPVSVDWTGPYIGATLGFGRVSRDGDRESGVGAGIHGGYNIDMGGWVAGGELTIAPGFNQTAANRDINWGGMARLRAGPKLDNEGRLWGFGTVGVAHVSHDAIGGGDRRSDNGWVAGFGVSHMMQNNMILTGEVLHARNRGDTPVRGTGVALGVSFGF